MKKIITMLAIAIYSIGFSQTETKTTVAVNEVSKPKLYEGTKVQASLVKDLKGGNVNVGEQIDFLLSEPIILGDRVICQKGAKILGTVTEARSSGVLGRKGKLAFSIDFLYMPSGQVIALRSQNNKRLNGSGVAVVAGAILLTPLSLLIPGKGAKFKEGTVFECFVDKDTFID